MEKRTFTAEWAVPIAHHALNPLDRDSILLREPLSGSIRIAIHESFLWLRKFSLEAHSARSADFQSTVSPNFIRQGFGICEALLSDRRPADCKSAIQQSATLRYSVAAQAALGSSVAKTIHPNASVCLTF